jgi:hypothetical protein
MNEVNSSCESDVHDNSPFSFILKTLTFINIRSFVIDFVIILNVMWNKDMHHVYKNCNGNMVGWG